MEPIKTVGSDLVNKLCKCGDLSIIDGETLGYTIIIKIASAGQQQNGVG